MFLYVLPHVPHVPVGQNTIPYQLLTIIISMQHFAICKYCFSSYINYMFIIMVILFL